MFIFFPKKIDAIAQTRHLFSISTLPVVTDEYVAKQAQESYIASICRPDCAFTFCRAPQYPNYSEVIVQALNRVVASCKQSLLSRLSVCSAGC